MMGFPTLLSSLILIAITVQEKTWVYNMAHHLPTLKISDLVQEKAIP
jgi:hypothetical protein